MSSIGLIEPITDYDEFGLVRISGGHGGDIIDCDGDTVMAVAEKDMDAAETAFPLIIQMYRMGFAHGERTGAHSAKWAIQTALGIGGMEHRVDALERNVFPGEYAA